MFTWWQILGIKKDSTVEESKSAFRRLALICHPDRGGSEHLFQILKQASEASSGTKIKLYTEEEVQVREKSAYMEGAKVGAGLTKTNREAPSSAAKPKPVKTNDEKYFNKDPDFYKSELIAGLGILAVIIPIILAFIWPHIVLPIVYGITVPLFIFGLIKGALNFMTGNKG